MALTGLSQVRLVASDPALVTAAAEAFELTRPIHRAEAWADLGVRVDTAKAALDRFIAVASADVQAVPRPARAEGSALS